MNPDFDLLDRSLIHRHNTQLDCPGMDSITHPRDPIEQDHDQPTEGVDMLCVLDQ